VVKNAIESKKLRRENVDLKKQLHSKSVIVGDSIPMKALRQQIGLMAPTNGRVLIYGESGTGKELVATPSTPKPAQGPKLSSKSTAPPSPKISSRANSSVTTKDPSPARPPTKKASSRRPAEARSFSTKSAT
jgi:hypothetical protein